MPKLTIGMATYGDFDGVYFTVQALRAYHDMSDKEILIIDNQGNKRLKNWCNAWGDSCIRYIYCGDIIGTSFPRHMVFEYALGEYVICIDSHVLLLPGSLDKLWEGDCLIHGPMVYDNFKSYVTHMKDEWRDNMWGIWADAVEELPDEPFEIPMHGLGLFGSRKDSWLGFNINFKGFGGEEGYIHEKYRKAGKKVMCLPWMKWLHKFNDAGVPYPLNIKDRVRNYFIGFNELGLDTNKIYEHFGYNLCKEYYS